MTISQLVSLTDTEAKYPEYPYGDSIGSADSLREGGLTRCIENLFRGLGLDQANQETSQWNPLRDLVKPGQTILLKPNWVLDYNSKGSLDCLVTHSAIIRPLIDYSVKALDGNGRIVIADAPLQFCDFEKLQNSVKITDLIENYRSTYPQIEFVVEDWRLTVTERTQFLGKETHTAIRTELDTDTQRYEVIDVGEYSLLKDIEDYASDFRVTCYDANLIKRHHKQGIHEYLVSRRVLESDLIINVPKMKTHIKAGVTCAMKNLIGINGHKEYLPHHIRGAYEQGGDNYLLSSWFKGIVENVDEWFWNRAVNMGSFTSMCLLKFIGGLWRAARIISRDGREAGSWSGNETIWRTMLDLNHILYFYDAASRSFSKDPVRNVLHVVDGIIAGEGEGPLEPNAVPLGKLIAGFSPVAVDAVASSLMGYNLSRIHSVYHGMYNIKSFFNVALNGPLNICHVSNDSINRIELEYIEPYPFRLPKYWHRAVRGDMKDRV